MHIAGGGVRRMFCGFFFLNKNINVEVKEEGPRIR